MAMLLRAATARRAAGYGRRGAASMPGQKAAFGYGEVAPKDAPGFESFQKTPPESVGDTVKYLSKGMAKLPLRKEIIEALGYPGQKHSSGTLTTVGRIYYGPGRYDYGRPEMPKSWFANFFYCFWEAGHIMVVSDRWIMFRQIRHFVATFVCFCPLWLMAKWNVEAWEQFKAKYPN
eukprot:TRINITY_DN4289_c0_g1_i1.p1 TRINITY_DN4289_c0_g1~~TRINITY_DN4289_c0_g1_i1.p1  ORF type:complete len:176 (-),score=49.71 TRINITY_DN4289_c0_g1_i1:142-669(-)